VAEEQVGCKPAVADDVRARSLIELVAALLDRLRIANVDTVKAPEDRELERLAKEVSLAPTDLARMVRSFESAPSARALAQVASDYERLVALARRMDPNTIREAGVVALRAAVLQVEERRSRYDDEAKRSRGRRHRAQILRRRTDLLFDLQRALDPHARGSLLSNLRAALEDAQRSLATRREAEGRAHRLAAHVASAAAAGAHTGGRLGAEAGARDVVRDEVAPQLRRMATDQAAVMPSDLTSEQCNQVDSVLVEVMDTWKTTPNRPPLTLESLFHALKDEPRAPWCKDWKPRTFETALTGRKWKTTEAQQKSAGSRFPRAHDKWIEAHHSM
jgi:hypothetical protein